MGQYVLGIGMSWPMGSLSVSAKIDYNIVNYILIEYFILMTF